MMIEANTFICRRNQAVCGGILAYMRKFHPKRGKRGNIVLLTNFIFGETFKKVTDEWKERTGQDLKVLAIDTKISPNDISRYRKGSSIPKKETLMKLCEYLGVEPSVFGYSVEKEKYTFTDDEAKEHYKDDKNYMRHFIATQMRQAEEFGLSEDFLRWMKELDATKRIFPLYRYHILVKENPHDFIPDKYTRIDMDTLVSVDVDSPYQVQINGQTYTLRYPDYAFISEMQKYLEECAEFFMYRRNREMQLEDEEVERRAYTKKEDGGICFTMLSQEELREIDPYRHYLIKKKKRSE